MIPSREASKAVGRLPRAAQERGLGIVKEIEAMGPVRGDWPNYGKLSGNRHPWHNSIIDKKALGGLKEKSPMTISQPPKGNENMVLVFFGLGLNTFIITPAKH